MSKHTLGNHPTSNPYRLLALNVLDEAFRTIKCYFMNKGSKEELDEGRKSIRWIRRMEGNYKIIAGASGFSLAEFHQMCIWKINSIKLEAINEKNEKE